MGNVLVFLEQADRRLRPAALSAISLSRAIHKSSGGKLLFVLIGDSVADAAKEAAQFGADGVFTVEAPQLKHYLGETYAPIIARIAKEQGASIVAGCATSVETTAGPTPIPRSTRSPRSPPPRRSHRPRGDVADRNRNRIPRQPDQRFRR